MGGCLSSESKEPRPSSPPAASSPAPVGPSSQQQQHQQEQEPAKPAVPFQQPTSNSITAPEPADTLPAASNGNGPTPIASTCGAAPDAQQQLAEAPSGPSSLTVSGPTTAFAAGAGIAPAYSLEAPDDEVSRTLATGGTLLAPPTAPRDVNTGADHPRPTPTAALVQAVNSSETGSFQNPDGSGVNPPSVQPSGFQCMPASMLAKEVAQLSWVGHGGYGAVYKGVWQGANVAVKFTVADYMDFAGASAHEAVLSKMLSHPNVVQTFASRVALLDEDFLRSVFDGETNFPSRELPVDSFRSGEGFGSPYGVNTSMKFRDVLTHIGARPGHYITQMIMEYCDRGSLHQAIAKGLFKSSTKWNNKIALRALLRTAREIGQGMSHLHACRVVHGDLKPGNVLLMSSRADRRGFTAKVSDFGLSTYCMASHTSVTRWSTVSYMAPEAFEGHLTMGSDTFSFGVLLWEMYTGQQPYAGLQAAQIVMGVQAGQLTLEWPPDSDPRIVELVEGCIQRNPAARPTFSQLIAQLTSLEALIRLEAPPSEGASEVKMPLLQGGGGGGGAGSGMSYQSPPQHGAAAAAAAPPPPPPPAAFADPASAAMAMAGLAAPPAGAVEELAAAGLTPPPLPPEELAAAMGMGELAMPMLTPPPLPPEEEAEVMAAAAAKAAAAAAAAAGSGLGSGAARVNGGGAAQVRVGEVRV
ncbi:hypothetical protein PLESTB_000481300 [Pleodorina starrii]|uniref:Protein kinase domain-containing protein n=1 Tax=Pleodorina starrii TaxID=330485 RepID=A0A9W6F0D7_9CHLO|nr:hypothetical protein PLESTM_001585200 [Pleodorina starrii]GLC51240.1 hypothetical protein PLESTB_000481300 [Pleodorina starrii]GLC63599.1 hypothetical protein PLESTF_000053700 [Pleodorina starrii]